MELPELSPEAEWSVCIRDAADARVLAAHRPELLLRTASVGKVFLLAEVARRLESGEWSDQHRLTRTDGDLIADSGLWWLMATDTLPVADLCLLVGAVSDNLATNVLLGAVGIEPVRRMARALGCAESALLDRVRADRGPQHPPTLSVGRADELSAALLRLHRAAHQPADRTDQGIGPGAAARVLGWLATDTDLSMVASAFGLDPLAHAETDRGVRLVNKTGTISTARIDIGLLTRGARTLAYAAAANWHPGSDPRDAVLADLAAIGRAIDAELRRSPGTGAASAGR